MPTPLIDSLISAGELVLFHDYRTGHTLDLSGSGNVPTTFSANWTNDGARADGGDIIVPNSASLQLTEGTLLMFGLFCCVLNNQRIFEKRFGGSNHFSLYLNTGIPRLEFFAGGATRLGPVVDPAGARCHAINFNNNVSAAEHFIDGISAGAFNAAQAVVPTADNLYIGTSPFNTLVSPLMSAALIVNRELTATEHAQIYGELANLTWPRKGKGRAKGEYGPELITDGDMEAAGTGAWTVGAGGALTKETASRPLAGNQVLRVTRAGAAVEAYQDSLVTGTRYRARGWFRGDGVASPSVALGVGGTEIAGTVSTTWQYFDFVAVATTARLLLNRNVAGGNWCEFDLISVQEEIIEQTRFKTDYQTRVIPNVAPGAYIPNTPFLVSAGAFAVNSETVDGEECKVIECTNAGTIYMLNREMQDSPFQSAYGTWEFWFSKDAASTSLLSFISNATGTAGYYVGLSLTEVVSITRIGAASVMTSAAGYVTADTWYKYTVTRRQSDGQFAIYIDDTLVPAATGANPGAENTVTQSEVIGLVMGTGDKIAYSDRAGAHNLRKLHGVVAP